MASGRASARHAAPARARGGGASARRRRAGAPARGGRSGAAAAAAEGGAGMELPPRWQVSKTDPAASTAPPRARVHFVGIGGAGLSALALLALRHGWFVSGSDRAASARAETLREAGATVMCGDHTSANLRQGGSSLPDVVVASSAVPRTNPELLAARALGVPVVGRDEWLAFVTRGHALLAVAGTHGKTTTSAMLAVALRDGGERPVTAVVGGDVPQLPGGTNAVADAGHARGDPFVLEADEYDGAFLKLDPLVAVINNVEWDHVDIYDSEDAVHAAFARFASRVRPGGALLACGDNAGALRVADETRERLEARASDEVEGGRQASQVRTFGTAEGNDYRASELETNSVGGTDFVLTHAGEQLCEVSLPVPGMHNVRNACAAVVTAALAAELRGEDATAAASGAARALGDFRGVGRRFEVVGAARSAGVAAVVDDYAHHPTEVIATLQGARQRYPGRPLWAVFQPHTHARLAIFEDDFVASLAAADRVIVAPVFEARAEDPAALGAATPRELAARIVAAGAPAVDMSSLDDVVDRLSFELSSGLHSTRGSGVDSADKDGDSVDADSSSNADADEDDVVILTLGAGDVTSVGRRLLERLQ